MFYAPEASEISSDLPRLVTGLEVKKVAGLGLPTKRTQHVALIAVKGQLRSLLMDAAGSSPAGSSHFNDSKVEPDNNRQGDQE